MAKKLTVQDFAESLCAFIEEYLADKEHYKDPVMTIGYVKGTIAFEIYEPHKVNRPEDYEEYQLDSLYVIDELGVGMPNYEAIEQIATHWVEKASKRKA